MRLHGEIYDMLMYDILSPLRNLGRKAHKKQSYNIRKYLKNTKKNAFP